jgi:RNA polymerase sigma-70 factor (ECF subfamily)
MATATTWKHEPASPEQASKPTEAASRMDFAGIVRDHGKALLARALWLTKQEAHASDLFQGTLERALKAGKFIPDDRVLRWLMTIMHNAFLDERRSECGRRLARNGAEVLEQIADDPSDLAEQPMWRWVDEAALSMCVRALPAAMGQIYALHHGGASYRDLAKELNIPSSTVGTRILRMRRRLRESLLAMVTQDAGGTERGR